MIQVKICKDEIELNEWLEEYSETYLIRDIKFGYCGTNSWTHERYMIIYEKPSDYTEMPPLQDLLDEYYQQRMEEINTQKEWLDRNV